MKALLLILLCTITGLPLIAQSEINAWVRDAKTQEAIPYVSIEFLGKNTGTLTNEEGMFIINLNQNRLNDSLLIQHIGYLPIKASLIDFKSKPSIYLTEDIYELNEVVLLANTPNIKNIIQSTIHNKDLNYKKQSSNTLAFIRKRNIDYTNHFDIEEKKTDIDQIDDKLLNGIGNYIPKESYYYVDFLGHIYFNSTDEDENTAFKVDPIKTVELKNKSINELDYFYSVFDSLFSNTSKKEYWKIKSGILGQKIDNTPPESNLDSISDTEKLQATSHTNFKESLIQKLQLTRLDSEFIWDFLHHPNRYEFEFAGTTYIENDGVYIIDFLPKDKGLYEGRVYINTNNYAIIKADFNYLKGKVGKQFQLFGVGYEQSDTRFSIAFEKINNSYQVKYFSYQITHDLSFDRKIALQKLKSRFLFDKKIHEIKVALNLSMKSLKSFEYLAINQSTITQEIFADFNEVENLNTIYVEQFNSDLWEGYPIIQPTKKMKNYKKASNEL